MQGIATATETRDQFLQLLVTQLRNQDPLEPVKQEDFLGQLAQFSTLEGIENLNSNLEAFLSNQTETQVQQNALLADLQEFQNLTGAASMVGATIDFVDADGITASGQVEAVVIQEGGVHVRVNDELVPMDAVREIRPTEAISTNSSERIRRSDRFA